MAELFGYIVLFVIIGLVALPVIAGLGMMALGALAVVASMVRAGKK